jgi:putative nucleotidyltransferase with HDIG domain
MIRGEILIARMDALPTLPEAAARLAVLLRDERATAADFEKVIRPDLALTANLLRAANSVFYKGVREITSVRDAVARMGVRRVYEVATSASFRRVLPRRIQGYDVDVAAFWPHCVSVGLYCERLARASRVAAPDIAYTAGLLHDVGKLVIGTCIAQGDAPAPRSALDSVFAEREALGIDHADVGEEIALRWRLPLSVKDAARYHHEPSLAPEGSDRTMAALVHLSDLLARRSGFAAYPAVPVPDYDPGALALLDTDPAKLERLALEVNEEIRAMSELTQGEGS